MNVNVRRFESVLNKIKKRVTVIVGLFSQEKRRLKIMKTKTPNISDFLRFLCNSCQIFHKLRGLKCTTVQQGKRIRSPVDFCDEITVFGS